MEIQTPKKTLNITPRSSFRHSWFEVGLLIVVIGLFYWFLILPKKTQINTLQAQYDQLNTQDQSIENTESKLSQAVSDMRSHPTEVAYLDEALPLDNRVTKLYIALQNITQNSGMTVGDINIDSPSGDVAGDKDTLANPYAVTRTLQKFTTALTVTGTFDQFQQLLKRIESSGRLLDVTGVNIQPSETDLFQFTISLQAYYYE